MKKSNRRNASPSSNNSIENEGKATMKKSNRRNASPADPRLAAFLAAGMSEAQAAAILAAMGNASPAPAAPAVEAEVEVEAKKERTPRQYEAAFLTGSFKKRLIASPCTDDAAAYYAECAALCGEVLAALAKEKNPAPILGEVVAIAAKVSNDADFDAAAAFIDLASHWEIPAPSMRVVIQLAIPVITPCCDDVDMIARRAYGMGKANALMGSACNTLMYSKASPAVDFPLPFKRVCYNATALGLHQNEAASLDDCDFVTDESDFTKLVSLCHHWLCECKARNAALAVAPAAVAPVRGRRGAKEPAPAADPRLAAFLAAGMSEAQAAAILAALK